MTRIIRLVRFVRFVFKKKENMNKEDIVKYVRERYIYDAEAGAIRHKGSDRAVKGRLRKNGYLYTCVGPNADRSDLTLHRVVWILYYGKWPTQIDHINGDKTDNRMENLREVSDAENCENRIRPWRPNARTGLPGVYQKTDGRICTTRFKMLCFSDQHEAFITAILLGRMYRDF